MSQQILKELEDLLVIERENASVESAEHERDMTKLRGCHETLLLDVASNAKLLGQKNVEFRNLQNERIEVIAKNEQLLEELEENTRFLQMKRQQLISERLALEPFESLLYYASKKYHSEEGIEVDNKFAIAEELNSYCGLTETMDEKRFEIISGFCERFQQLQGQRDSLIAFYSSKLSGIL